jgi:hypothetical protein
MDRLHATIDATAAHDQFLLVGLAAISICRRLDVLLEQHAPAGLASDAPADDALLALLGAVGFRLRLHQLFSAAIPQQRDIAAPGTPSIPLRELLR